jgi:HicB family
MGKTVKRIIDRITYNTDTATALCELPCATIYQSDFLYHETSLYLTRSGHFFLSGWGNAKTLWATAEGQNSWSGGDGIRPCTPDEAREYLEEAGATEVIERLFPESLEVGEEIDDEVRSTLRLPANLRDRLANAAEFLGISLNAYMVRALEKAIELDSKARN